MKKALKLLLVASMMFTFLATGTAAQFPNQVKDVDMNVYRMIIEPDYYRI